VFSKREAFEPQGCGPPGFPPHASGPSGAGALRLLPSSHMEAKRSSSIRYLTGCLRLIFLRLLQVLLDRLSGLTHRITDAGNLGEYIE